MLTAVVTSSGPTIEVTLLGADFVTAEEGEEAAGPENDLNPIAPELKEVVTQQGDLDRRTGGRHDGSQHVISLTLLGTS